MADEGAPTEESPQKRRQGQRGPDRAPRKKPKRKRAAAADPMADEVHRDPPPADKAKPSSTPDADDDAGDAKPKAKQKLGEQDAGDLCDTIFMVADAVAPVPASMIFQRRLAKLKIELDTDEQQRAFAKIGQMMLLSEDEKKVLRPPLVRKLAELEFDPDDYLLYLAGMMYGGRLLGIAMMPIENFTAGASEEPKAPPQAPKKPKPDVEAKATVVEEAPPAEPAEPDEEPKPGALANGHARREPESPQEVNY